MMTKEEIKEYVENDIQYHMDEFGLEREEVEGVVMDNIILRYIDNKISKEDMLQCADYLKYDLNLDIIENKKNKK